MILITKTCCTEVIYIDSIMNLHECIAYFLGIHLDVLAFYPVASSLAQCCHPGPLMIAG